MGSELVALVRRAVGPMIGVVAGAMLVTVAGAASAPPVTGTIYSCVGGIEGYLRIVGASQACRHNESPLNWISGSSGGGGVSGLEVVTSAPIVILGQQHTGTQQALCPTGKKALSGGYKLTEAGSGVDNWLPLISSLPFGGSPPTGWEISVRNTGIVDAQMTVTVVCATAS